MSLGAVREQGLILPSHEMFRGVPGYDPLDLRGDAPELATPPSPILVSVRQEDWRGGRIDITEFIPPAPDVAMHFGKPVSIDDDNVRSCIADLLTTTTFCATFTYNGAPDGPSRPGIYYSSPPPEGRHSYQLEAGELLVGRPKVYETPEPSLYQLSDMTDAHSADAHRVVADADQLAEVIDIFGWALGLGQPDRQALMQHITAHAQAARIYRRMRILGEAIASLR